jgi:aldehyde dehydrogenase (NAD+)
MASPRRGGGVGRRPDGHVALTRATRRLNVVQCKEEEFMPQSADVRFDRLFIGGEWQRPSSSDEIVITSASTGQVMGHAPAADTTDVDRAVAAARAAFDDPAGWSAMPAAERAAVMERFAEEIERRGPSTAITVTQQMGMPIALSSAVEADFPALILRYYAGLIREHGFEEERPAMTDSVSVIVREPIGVVAAIVPWNSPQASSFMKIAPALAAGCTVVLKPATETVLDSFAIAEAAIAAGLPAGVLNIVPTGRGVGQALVEHPGVDKVSFTGSTAAGRTIAEACGRLLRPVTLELGGKSATVLLDDVDVARVTERLFPVTLLNSGQICVLGTRILAPRSRYDEIVDSIARMSSDLRVGDPLDPTTQVGPLVSERQRDRVENYIGIGRREGARIVAGGGRPAGRDDGWFVEPTVFADVDNRSTIAQEEIFGPVLTITPFDDDDEALRLTNDSIYGLGGSVWTADPTRGDAFARRAQSGTFGVNGYANDLFSPFGGIKASGLGRELGPEGMQAYQYVKTIYRYPPLG